ncbi:MAG TPA: 3'-5' exonuclease, partial [Methylomirabilota bacterium]|nr:3'-5' exonuclease [Methylomirabilota bacterium]
AVAGPPVEILLRLTDADNESPGDADDAVPAEADPATLLEEEKEARMVGLRLRELHASRVTVWDAAAGAHRPVAWGDMVILLRAPALKVESYAKEFDRLGIPLQAKRSGFFQSIEVLDLLNILRLLDNPLQDIPAIAVLRSPLVGLSLDELADIRMAARRERFWTALLRWHDMERERARADGAAAHSAWPRVEAFLKQFQRWRDLARHSSLARRLEIILSETCYLDWLAAQPRGAQRRANVQLLLTLAREFDELHQQGLYRFLQMIEDHHETVGDREPAPLETADAVRLMSIHQSKGLEFPVVVVADLGKRFNVSDNGGGILLDDEFGLCPYVRPPDGGPSYPSLPAWLARRRQHAEALGEEMRLLYVAMTRAEDRLILAGSVTAKKAESAWADHAAPQPELWRLLQAGSYFDWLGPWLTHHAGRRDWFHAARGHTELWAWRVCREADLTAAAPPHGDMTSVPQADLPSPDPLPSLLARLAWTYPHQAATREPAKTSVTALRQRLADVEDDESRPAAWLARERFTSRPPEQGTLDAAAIGNAHHRFLQLVRLDQTADLAGLEAERRRLASAGLLAAPEVAALDLVALARFWSSDLGREIRARAAWVRRELPFTLRLGPEDCPEGLAVGVPPSEFIVVQGVVDLAVLLPEEIWLLDFKTDAVDASSPEERAAHYAPQVRLYRLALERIHRRPVTRCWLHFLAIGRTVSVPAHPAPTGPEPRAANEPG